jgi:WhiB family redox-sensing transcriptional regulator
VNPLIPSLMRAPGSHEECPGSLEDWLGRPSWHERAACRGDGAERFIRGPKAQYDEALLTLCRDCPVRQECLEAALADPDLQGLWGGTTERERREIRRQAA